MSKEWRMTRLQSIMEGKPPRELGKRMSEQELIPRVRAGLQCFANCPLQAFCNKNHEKLERNCEATVAAWLEAGVKKGKLDGRKKEQREAAKAKRKNTMKVADPVDQSEFIIDFSDFTIPEGYEPVGFRVPLVGDYFITHLGYVDEADGKYSRPRLILRKLHVEPELLFCLKTSEATFEPTFEPTGHSSIHKVMSLAVDKKFYVAGEEYDVIRTISTADQRENLWLGHYNDGVKED